MQRALCNHTKWQDHMENDWSFSEIFQKGIKGHPRFSTGGIHCSMKYPSKRMSLGCGFLQTHDLVLIQQVNDIHLVCKRIRIGSLMFLTKPSRPTIINNTNESINQNLVCYIYFCDPFNTIFLVILPSTVPLFGWEFRGPGKIWLMDWSSQSLLDLCPV